MPRATTRWPAARATTATAPIPSADEVVESPGEGRDTVYATLAAYTLPDNVEDLIFRSANRDELNATGPATGKGNALGNRIVGGLGADTLSGLAGNDLLVGNPAPSTAADRLVGGVGNDVYEVDLLTDRIVEKKGEGIDTVRIVRAAATPGGAEIAAIYSLDDPTRSGVENLVVASPFAGGPSTGMTLIGNALGNAIVGTDEADDLYGLAGNDRLFGGAGPDVMRGGLGGDYYDVDTTADVVTEFGDYAKGPGRIGGRDTIATSLSGFSLGSKSYAVIENLTARPLALDGGGYAEVARKFTGNGLDNDLVGGFRNDLLRGLGGNDYLIGGRGNDTLDGGAGDDDYEIDSPGDVVRETNGHDTVATSLTSFSLSKGGLARVEDLTSRAPSSRK